MKTCGRCKASKTLSSFYVSRRGTGAWCKECQRAYYAEAGRLAKERGVCRHHKLPLKENNGFRCERCFENDTRARLQRVGMTQEKYAALLVAQGGGCAICGRVAAVCDRRKGAARPRRLAVDHDHKTGVVRGLLCTNCNTAIGKAQDSPEILDRMTNYLQPTEWIGGGC